MSQPTPPEETVVGLPDDVRASLIPVPTVDATPDAPAAERPQPEPVADNGLVAQTAGASHRADLGDGQWADILDPANLRSGHRKQVIRKLDQNVSMGSSAVDMTDEVLKIAVLGWSLPLPIPSVDPSSLNALTLDQEDRLQSDPVVLEITGQVVPSRQQAAQSPSEPSADPASPTRPSNA